MPEIPDLEAIRGFIEPRLRGNPVAGVELTVPWLVRTGSEGVQALVGHEFVTVRRYGKFLLFATDDDQLLVVNPMLTGRFQWADAAEKKRAGTCLTLRFEDGHQLRYADARRMGRWYLVPVDGLMAVPQFEELGPDALEVDEETFLRRIRRHAGQIKSVLTNQKFIAGIGNAYSDEILWEAKLHPHRRRSTMDEDDLRGLYHALRSTLEWARPILEAEVAEGLFQSNEEWRAHLRVHRKGGEPCPRCGNEVRSQVRGGSETNYCLHCQPLSFG
ncbi:MAG: Fpg/Nei family DNA glycosylase [Dehalococcoidia bacterium]